MNKILVIIKDVPKRVKQVRYTLAHRRAFREVERKFYGRVSLRGYLHDLDKVFLYPILGVKLTHKLHRRFSAHHAHNAKTNKDFREMVIDWECARLTKPDKPLNAYDTLYRYYPQLEPYVLPILKELGIASRTQ